MNEMEKKEIVQRTKAMDAEEQRLALKAIPTIVLLAEVQRRIEVNENMIAGMKALLRMPERGAE